jgi:hypothetical protein
MYVAKKMEKEKEIVTGDVQQKYFPLALIQMMQKKTIMIAYV